MKKKFFEFDDFQLEIHLPNVSGYSQTNQSSGNDHDENCDCTACEATYFCCRSHTLPVGVTAKDWKALSLDVKAYTLEVMFWKRCYATPEEYDSQ